MRGMNGGADPRAGYPMHGGVYTNNNNNNNNNNAPTTSATTINGSSGGTVLSGGGATANGPAIGLAAPPGGLLPPGLAGGELKHHADFLTRLLAATPSYMSEMGNPPPGFFSDWLRRLVSKPSGNCGLPNISPPTEAHRAAAAAAQQHQQLQQRQQPQSSPPHSGYHQHQQKDSSETNGDVIPNKRRKRSRINDSPTTTTTNNVKDNRTSPPASSTGRITPAVSTSGGNTTSNASAAAAAAAAAAALGNPFAGAHPLWFFPPFMPNPYMPSIPGLSPAAAASYLSHNASELFRPENLLGGLHPPMHPFPPGLDPMFSERERLLAATRNSTSSPTPTSTTGGGANSSNKASAPTTTTSAGSAVPFGHHHHHGLGLSSHHHHHPGLSSHHASLLQHAGLDPSSFSSGLHPHLRREGAGGGGEKQEKQQHQQQQGMLKRQQQESSSGSPAKKEKRSSSSFSISRLTSPSPSSSNSSSGGGGGSGGTVVVSGGNSVTSGRLLQHHLESAPLLPPVRPGSRSSGGGGGLTDEKLFGKHGEKINRGGAGGTTTGSGKPSPGKNVSGDLHPSEAGGGGLCVDLRVSGRIWESSGCSSAPQSIYKPLSAFREPADAPVNPYNSSPPLPKSAATTTPTNLAPSFPTQQQQQHHHGLQVHNLLSHPPPDNWSSSSKSTTSSSPRYPPNPPPNLSTRYILGNLQHIYQKVKPNGKVNINSSSSNSPKEPLASPSSTGLSAVVKPSSSKYDALNMASILESGSRQVLSPPASNHPRAGGSNIKENTLPRNTTGSPTTTVVKTEIGATSPEEPVKETRNNNNNNYTKNHSTRIPSPSDSPASGGNSSDNSTNSKLSAKSPKENKKSSKRSEDEASKKLELQLPSLQSLSPVGNRATNPPLVNDNTTNDKSKSSFSGSSQSSSTSSSSSSSGSESNSEDEEHQDRKGLKQQRKMEEILESLSKDAQENDTKPVLPHVQLTSPNNVPAAPADVKSEGPKSVKQVLEDDDEVNVDEN